MFGTKHSKTNRLQMTIEYKTNEQNRMQNMKIYWNIQIEIYNHIRLVLAVFAALPSLHSRDTLVIRGIKKENQDKTWNNTSHVLSSSLCGLFGWNPNQFLSDIERAHRGDYKNLDSPIYVKFISWKVSQAVLDSIIRANRSRQNNISASQKYSDKVQKIMNRLLITRNEFKNDEEKSSWKSYVKYPGVLMVKKPENRNYSVSMVASD